MSKGILVVVSGFSGAGKGTVMKRLLEKYDDYALSVSVTTRAPRPGEEDGIAYFFRSREEFEQLIREDALIEYAQYVENYYGTPRSYVEEQLSAGRNVILEIEIQGAMKVKEKIPEALLVFVTPPTVAELEKRLKGRGTETDQVIADRLARAGEEAKGMDQYDYILVDTVPYGLVADAQIISRIADLCIYVIREGVMDRRQLPEIENLYTSEKLPGMSVLLNGVCNKHAGYGYGYGYYGYGYYGYGYASDSNSK